MASSPGVTQSELASTTIIFNPGIEMKEDALMRLGITGPVTDGYDDVNVSGYIGSIFRLRRRIVWTEMSRPKSWSSSPAARLPQTTSLLRRGTENHSTTYPCHCLQKVRTNSRRLMIISFKYMEMWRMSIPMVRYQRICSYD